MHWLTFFILAYVATAVQSTLLAAAAGGAVGGAAPNLLLAVALYYALAARRAEAPWAALAAGLIADLASSYPFGAYGATFALAGWSVVRIRAHLFGEHPLSVATITLAVAFVVELLAGTVGLLRLGGQSRPWGQLFWTAFLTAVFTAAAAAPLHWLLRRPRCRRLLGTPSLATG